jgi:hypothetical protein
MLVLISAERRGKRNSRETTALAGISVPSRGIDRIRPMVGAPKGPKGPGQLPLLDASEGHLRG